MRNGSDKELVAQAKKILMSAQGMNEEEAHRFLQRQSMDRRKSLKEIAEAILLSSSVMDSSRRMMKQAKN
jgi:response regulator NasT